MSNTSLRFEVLTEVLMKIQGFMDVRVCLWVKCSRHLEDHVAFICLTLIIGTLWSFRKLQTAYLLSQH